MPDHQQPIDLIDAQVHIWERDHPQRPWTEPAARAGRHPQFVECEQFITILNRAGVDGAILTTPRLYGTDNSYLLAAAEEHPDRFRVVGRVPTAATEVDGAVAVLAAHPAAVGVRLVARTPPAAEKLRSGGFEPLAAAAQRHGLAVCVLAPDYLDQVARLAARHPGLAVVVDHLGLPQEPLEPLDADGFDRVAGVLALAQWPNVTVKITGAPALSTEPYPFTDVWRYVRRLLDAFGAGRLMWGTDWTRVSNADYDEGVRYLLDSPELGAPDKATLMGATARRVFGWPRT